MLPVRTIAGDSLDFFVATGQHQAYTSEHERATNGHRVGRLPGLPSSKLGLQSLTGELDSFGFESYLGGAEEREVPGPDLHSQMEAHLRLGTKPCTRGL